ncbi:MAG TPA: 5-(carboxyamino)imidazole ribonucleotide synthase [Candidatus Dormibacteraeota bacterium]|nr:5-(carboxyamino)imidazole ribonucleotide synthase [Candidatus Dormibacteraeota bacterium]
MESRPIGRYRSAPATVEAWDPRTVEVARRVARLVNERRPGTIVEHIGSSAVPGLAGKNVVDLALDLGPEEVDEVAAVLVDLGFERQSGPRAFPPTRPLLLGALEHEGREFRIHAHVMPRGHRLWGRDFDRHIGFRDALRANERLRDEYAALKHGIVTGGTVDSMRYSLAKTEWIRTRLEGLGLLDPPIAPPATIGVLGGGQLGRMLGYAARSLGYGLVVLDPDPECPASAVADRVVVGGYDDTSAALAMAETADVVTYELEHVSSELVARLDADWPVRPGVVALAATQDRLAERQAIEAEGIAVARWREVRDAGELRDAAAALGLPLRLKVATGGYDGRGQLRLASPVDLTGAIERLGRPQGETLLAERELDFAMELSVIVARDDAGRALPFPVARNRHDRGILVESVAPAPVAPEVVARAEAIGRRLAEALDIVGTLAVELFLLPDGSLVVNELAPRVHNTGHWTVEACATSQFEQHVRAICGLPLGSPELRTPVALVNLLGTGERRPARPSGVPRALAVPGVHVHLYGKREVFERRKMGHVVATAESTDEALGRAREAAAAIGWEVEA